MGNLVELSKKLHSAGIPVEAAAAQIADGLARPKAPRFLYTRGGGTSMALLQGFLQVTSLKVYWPEK
jgi:uncharacterized protein YgbK (DUF1537 family)